jgi:hypothetical protein
MGDWWIEKEMEMINENVLFHKAKVHRLFIVVVAAILINFLHKCQIDFTFEVIGE